MPITWIHISDLHRGQPGDNRWDRYRDIVLTDIRDRVTRYGRPDLILFTGDLAYAGRRSDYEKVDETLNDIYECVGEEALLVTVPGNHDLVRPDLKELQALACKQYFTDDDVRRSLLVGHKTTVGFFDGLFSEYQSWWKRRVLSSWNARRLRYKEGLFPGDFVVSLEKDDLRLGIAGINSSFLHFGDMDKGSLAVESEQHGPWSLSRWREENDASLLLMHHPRDWLHPSSLRGFLELVYPANTFTACCFGHMHEHGSETTIHSGSEVRRWIQAASLFGLERWGRKDQTRSIGYAWGRLEKTSPRTGILTRWPVEARPADGGSLAMFDGDLKRYPHTEEVELRERRAQTVCRVMVVAVPEEFPFAGTSLLRRIEELRPGLICTLLSADEDLPKPEPAELVVVLVGGLRGKGTTLVDHLNDRKNRVLATSSLDAKKLRRADSDPKGLAELIEQRGDASWFVSEDDILTSIRPALDSVCNPPAQLPEAPVDDPLVSYVMTDLEERRADAKAKFAAGAYDEALAAYRTQVDKSEQLRASNPNAQDLTAMWARANVNVAACLLALRDAEGARKTLVAITVGDVPEDARPVLAKLLINVREFENAERVIRQMPEEDTRDLLDLLSVSRGQIPTVRPDAADLLIYSAQLLAKDERFHTAFDWLAHAMPRIEDNVLGRLALAEAFLQLMERWAWAEKVDDPLSPADASALLRNLDSCLAELKGRVLAAPLERRVIEIENGLALRTDDLHRLDATRDAMTTTGGEPPHADAAFDAAVALGKSGDIQSAIRMVVDDGHAWRGRYRQIGILTVVGDYAAALELSLRLVQEFPGRLNTEYEAARQLARADRKPEAVGHARAAFEALPGYGQRLLLAELSLFQGEYSTCAELAGDLAMAGDVLALELFALATEHIDIPKAVWAWEKYAASDPKVELHARIRIAALQLRLGLHSEAAETAWRIVGRLDATELSLATLYQFALLQAVGAGVDARDRVSKIASAIKERAVTQSDEAMYLQLWASMEAPEELPSPNFESLVAAGALRPVTTVEIQEALEAGATQRTTMFRAFQLGHLPFEALSLELGWGAASFVSSVGEGLTFPAIDVADPEKTSSVHETPSRLIVSDLELLLSAKVGILEQLQVALAAEYEFLVFEDVHLRLMQNLSTLRMANPSARVAEADALIAAVADPLLLRIDELQPQDALIGSAVMFDRVVGWLYAKGAIPKTRAETLGSNLAPVEWEPPGNLACDGPSLRWLVKHGLLDLFARTRGAPLRISSEAAVKIRTERVNAKRDVEALALCERVAKWLEEQIGKHRARIVVRPSVDMPPAKIPSLEKPRSWVAGALSWRAAAEVYDAHCLALDACTRDLFSGLYLPSILHAINWTPESLATTKNRFQGQSTRVVGFGWIARKLSLPIAQRERLIRAGCSDVADAQTMADLLEEYPGSGALDSVFDVLEAPLRTSAHSKSLSAQLVLGRAYAAVLKELFGRRVSSAAQFLTNTLGRWELHGARGVSALLAFAMPAAFDKPSAGFADTGSGNYAASPTTSIGQLFSALVDWASRDNRRRSLLKRAAAEAVALIGKATNDSPGDATLGLLQLLSDLMPSDGPPIDLSDDFLGALAIVGAIWRKSPLETTGAEVVQTADGKSTTVDLVYEDVIREGVEQLKVGDQPMLTPLMASWDRPVFEGHIPVTVPVEAVLLRTEATIASEIAGELAVLQGPNDGVMYHLLRRLQQDPQDQAVRHEVAERAIRSPWKRTVRDPASILGWGQVEAVHMGAPYRLEDLEQLLSEPPGFEGSLSARARLEQYVTGFWKERLDIKTLAITATSVPGTSGYQAAMALAADETLEDALAILKHYQSSSFGQVWTSVAALWIAAKADRVIGDTSAREELQRLLPEIIAASVDDPSTGRLEAALLRQCRNIVSNFRPASHNLVWLTYRLFSWLWVQIRSSDARVTRRVVEELTAAPVAPRESDPARDSMDPASWREFPDIRLAAILNITTVGDAIPPPPGEERWFVPIGDELRAELVRVASTPITPADKQLRWFSKSQWEWLGTAVPQENALHLLLREPHNLSNLDPTTRRAWLQELPMNAEDGIQDRNVVGRLLLAVAAHTGSLSDEEKDALARCLTMSTSPLVTEGPAPAAALIALMREARVASGVVWPRIQNAVALGLPGLAVARVFIEALAVTQDPTLRERVRALMDHLRGPSDEDELERVRRDEMFADQSELLATLDLWAKNFRHDSNGAQEAVADSQRTK